MGQFIVKNNNDEPPLCSRFPNQYFTIIIKQGAIFQQII